MKLWLIFKKLTKNLANSLKISKILLKWIGVNFHIELLFGLWSSGIMGLCSNTTNCFSVVLFCIWEFFAYLYERKSSMVLFANICNWIVYIRRGIFFHLYFIWFSNYLVPTLGRLLFHLQVVSPEFTFYDGTKSSLDDSSCGEKLLRAKLDLSFMSVRLALIFLFKICCFLINSTFFLELCLI